MLRSHILKMKRAETMVVHSDDLTDDWSAQRQMLIVIRGDQLGVKIDLNLYEGPFTIGRSTDANLIIQDETASWLHCQVVQVNNCWYVEDLNSTNGTYIDTARMIGRQILESGDCFKVGKTIFKFLSTSEVVASYYEEIYRLAVCDGLTLLPNRRVFEETLDREFSRAQRHQRPLSLIIFDIDKFKNVNDNYGHLCGDLALRAIADTFRPRVRKEDLFARYAGDEFVWVLSEADIGQAKVFGEWLVAVCRQIKINFKQETLSLSLSVGIAQLTPELKTPKELLEAADQALYRAKANGRNCVSL